MRRFLTSGLLTLAAAVAMVALASGVAMADDPTDSITTPEIGEVYYRMAENLYSLHDTRLESCKLCHVENPDTSIPAGNAGMNPCGAGLMAALGLSTTGTSGGAPLVTSPVSITNALKSIESVDSDLDGVNNGQELWALSFPGDAGDVSKAVQSPDFVTVNGSMVFVPLGPHGGYGTTPDQCAICHRTHTAQAPQLLKQNQQALCYTCHSGSGASTDVKDGSLGGSGRTGLRGGGFANAVMDTNMSNPGTITSRATTSSHSVDGTPAMMWGSGAYTTTVSAGKANVTLECGNCHDPHMPAWSPDGGTTIYTQYRMLQGAPRESGTIGQNAVGGHGWYLAIPEDQTKHGFTSSYVQTYFPSTYTPTVNINRPDTSYQPNDRIGEFCALCHTRYLTGTVVANSADSYASVTEEVNTGDPVFMYQHATKESSCSTCHVSPPTGQQPPADATHKDAWSRPRCLDCHVAHGTAASMGTNSASVPWPGGVTPVASEGTQRSSLLRLNNRGVCTSCHEK